MSSDSDDRVSDHGAQIVESIEPVEDAEMYDVESSGDNHSQGTRDGSARGQGKVIKQEQVSDDSGDESDEPEEATQFSVDGGQKVDRAVDYEVAADIKLEMPGGRIPPSYQKPAAVDDEDSADDDYSADSTQYQDEDDSLLEDVAAEREKKSRKRQTPTGGPESQGMDGSADFQPKKKSKKAFNRSYLDLLNKDITQAASQCLSASHGKLDERMDLPSSQVGLTVWTSIEKERFFEALGRLGRDNTAGIAERIHTKGEMEVRQYMKLLQDALTHRRQQNELDPLGLEAFPAAVEISQECCQALEEVADNIDVRLQRSEMAAEVEEYGPDWLLYQENCKDLEDKAAGDISKATGLFRSKEWLSLSESFFMNSSTSEGNWHSVDGDTPCIWLSALDDFRTLALTLTRRLVAASNYMAATRLRAERGYRSQIRDFVKEKDVRAAALSLGIAAHKPPLTGSARRLGLSIYEKPPKPTENSDLGPLSVTDVEDALGIDRTKSASQLGHKMQRIEMSSDEDSSMSPDSSGASDAESEGEHGDSGPSDAAESEEEDEIMAEADEAIIYSAVDPPQTKRGRQALYRRIKAEMEQEKYADAVDMQASYQEELRMWSVLGQQPPESLVDPGPPRPGRRLKLSVDGGATVGKDWRLKTKVLSEWEAQLMGVS
ncbi:unnamed protein product [Discula destructiva]